MNIGNLVTRNDVVKFLNDNKNHIKNINGVETIDGEEIGILFNNGTTLTLTIIDGEVDFIGGNYV